jgi:hypothetical protein
MANTSSAINLIQTTNLLKTTTTTINTPRKCSICKNLSHTKNKCPNKISEHRIIPTIPELSATKDNVAETTGSNVNNDDIIQIMQDLDLNQSTGGNETTTLLVNTNSNELMSPYFAIIKCNKYINKYEADGEDTHSFSSLSTKKLSQSQNIKLGHSIEHFWADVLNKNTTGWKSIKVQNAKGIKEKDHLYINDKLMAINYCEQKNNINLDTEKSKATKDKLHLVCSELATKYPEYKINYYLFAARYLDTDTEQIAQNIIKTKKYENVVGVNNLLKLFDYPLPPLTSYSQYTAIIDNICATKFKLT